MKNKNAAKSSDQEQPLNQLKHDHRIVRNYLKAKVVDEINALMSATTFNLKIWMREMKKNIILLKILLRHFFFNSPFYQILILQN